MGLARLKIVVNSNSSNSRLGIPVNQRGFQLLFDLLVDFL